MKRGERGFTLIELAIGVAILGIIMPALTMTTATFLNNHQKANDHNIALCQVQNAGRWVSCDVQMARNLIFDAPSGFPLTLDIPIDMDESNDNKVVYSVDSSKLKRQVYDSSDNLTAETMIIGQVDVLDIVFSTADSSTYNLTAKVTKGEVVVERSYEIAQRIGSE
ncbi:MAG TPA: prepilin-type N-terminal cleavage/methylation domain-containing protein [Dehalococcoidales bacterium]|nr:prepilin-type N-terminal cleavage/methylation domain-containing protein [Dehalococcoidales bacterium]